MREIVLDTETTGLDPGKGHRVVEIACLELVNHVPSGRHFRRYLNPERDMPQEAFAVHGLSREFLVAHPVFSAVAEEFLVFIAESPLVIHNAEFDIGFINAELKRAGRPALEGTPVIDTVRLARQKFPGSPANLDFLCKRFGVDNSDRALHGALKDVHLLAEVYLHLIGGRQTSLGLSADAADSPAGIVSRRKIAGRPHQAAADEIAAHQALVTRLTKPIWNA